MVVLAEERDDMTRSDTVVLREVVLELLSISFCNISPDKVTWRNEYTF